jgi:trans-aconitate 2-methyltransferase
MAQIREDQWNPEQYQKFHAERSRPFWDLVKKIDFENTISMLDLGCGTGELTHALHVAHQLGESVGIDSSEKMLEETPKYKARGLTFERVDILDFKPVKPFDLVISNAALQWIDNHEALFGKIVKWIKPGGTLALQMPINSDHPSQKLAETVAKNFGLKPRISPVRSPEDYARLLWHLGLTNVDVTMKVYLHPMPSALEVVEWTKGTLLTFYQKQLSAQRFQEFLKQYTSELLRTTGEGNYLYTFKRVFLIARR